MHIIAQKHEKHWKIVNPDISEIYKKDELINLLESSNYVVWPEFLDLIVSNVPEDDNLIEVLQNFYKGKLEVLPF